MRDLSEHLKEIANMPEKEEATLEELEEISEQTIRPNYLIDLKTESFLNRMLPKCYTDFVFTNINVEVLSDETLFYIFYVANNTELQIKAYNEILNKGYFYSKLLEEFVCIPEMCIADNKKRSILVFNPFKWERENIEIVFDEKFIKSLETKKIPIDGK